MRHDCLVYLGGFTVGSGWIEWLLHVRCVRIRIPFIIQSHSSETQKYEPHPSRPNVACCGCDFAY